MLRLGLIDFAGLLSQFANPEGLLMIGGLLLLIGLSRFTGSARGKLTTGRLAGKGEVMAASMRGMKQAHALDRLAAVQLKPTKKQSSGRPRSASVKIPDLAYRKTGVALWCGTPRYWATGRLHQIGAWLQVMLGSPPTLYLPEAQRSVFVVGAPGSGKTFSVIDRCLESAFQQGFPVLLFDKKGDQLRLHAPLAARYGYDVQVFSPGRPYSSVINPLDFMRDEADVSMAREIAITINRNSVTGEAGKRDEFFAQAGDMLASALMQLVKSTLFPEDMRDLATVYSVLRLPKLVQRLEYAIYTGRIGSWVEPSFNQLIQAKQAEKTVSSILTMTSGVFSRFIQADVLPCLLGRSTAPTRIEGKQLVAFELDDRRRAALSPLVASALSSCVVNNLAEPRETPLIISLDELPALKLHQLPWWINEYRSNLGCFILGAQSFNQLYQQYGDRLGAAIISACATHVVFNPGDPDTAEKYSKRYGEKDVLLKNRSTGRSLGGNYSNRSLNWSESLQRVPLITADQILRFPPGRCILTSPGYMSQGEGNLPYLTRINIPKSDIERAEASPGIWREHVEPHLIDQAPVIDRRQLIGEMQRRNAQAQAVLPLPEGASAGVGAAHAPENEPLAQGINEVPAYLATDEFE